MTYWEKNLLFLIIHVCVQYHICYILYMYIYQKHYIVGSGIIRMIKSLFGSQPKLLLCSFIVDLPLIKDWSISELLQLRLKFYPSALLRIIQPSPQFSLQNYTFQPKLLPQEELPWAVYLPVSLFRQLYNGLKRTES